MNLNLEELEPRNCPAPVVTWHGGQVIHEVVVQPVLYGSTWREPAHAQEAVWIQQATADLVTGPYMDILAPYGVSRGKVLPRVLVDSSAGALDDATIQHALNSFVPPPDTLFVIFTAPSVLSTFGPYSSANYYEGYHYSTGNHERYAVVPYPGGPNYADITLPTLGQITTVVSHEIAEAVTDPDVNPVQTGWFADLYFGEQHYTSEVADLVQAYRFVYHDYWVQAEADVYGQSLYPSDRN